MNAQQAPNAGEDIWSQHSWRFPAVQMELTTAHSKIGGRISHRNQNANRVNIVFRVEENRFCLTQATGPVVLTGGGRSGCVPGSYSCRAELFTSYLKLTLN